jgi:hypothetical protein
MRTRSQTITQIQLQQAITDINTNNFPTQNSVGLLYETLVNQSTNMIPDEQLLINLREQLSEYISA